MILKILYLARVNITEPNEVLNIRTNPLHFTPLAL